jgi:ubiquinone/menaquinone biosynthesis C-methylase UbiE
MGVDPRAASGFASVADAYERGRPSYPAEAIDRVLADLGLTDASRVLDLAAGTGQLSRLLRTRVGTTIAVEPAQAMRTKLAATLRDVIVLDGTAEAIPLRDHEVHAVVVGEAFHWFRTAQATGEIARVLTDRGGIALLWNSPTWTVEDTPWLDDFRRIVAQHKRAAGGYPAGDGTWQREFERAGRFEELEHVQVSHAQTLDPIDFVAQVASWSWIANLDAGHRQVILDDVHAVVRGHDEIVIPYRTDLHLARRRGHAA